MLLQHAEVIGTGYLNGWNITESSKQNVLERLFRLNEAVVRFIILSAEEAPGNPVIGTPVHHTGGRYASAGRGG